MEENQRYIPERWVEITHLANLSKVFNGLSGKTKEDFGTGEPYIPYVNVFKNSKIDLSELDYVKVKIGERQNAVEYGDIIFTTSSETIEEVGMTSVFLESTGKYYLNSFCFILRLNNKNWLIPQFSQYLFRSEDIRYSISLLGQGSTRYNLSKTRLLKELKLLIPSDTKEQNQIATILSKVDKAIAQTKQLIAKYTRIKTGLMQDLLTKGIDEHGNIRSQQTHEFKDSPLGKIPKEWEVKRLDQMTKPNSPIVYGILMPGKHFFGGIPVIKVKDIFDEKIHFEDLLFTNPKIAQAFKRSELMKDDLLFTIRGTVGRCAFVPEELEGANITQDTARIRVKNEYKEYIRYAFETYNSKVYIQLNTVGQAVKGINLKALRELNILVPPPTEAHLIATKLNTSSNVLSVEATKLRKLQSLKAGLMQDLLSGKVRVNQLIEETAIL
jgi:type I restriction enzyme S subunit